MARATCRICKNIIDNNGICQSCGQLHEIPKEKVILKDVKENDKISIGRETLVCLEATKFSRKLMNVADRCKSLYYNLDFEL